MAAGDSAVFPRLAPIAEVRLPARAVAEMERFYARTGPQRWASPPPRIPAKVIAVVLVFQLGALVALAYFSHYTDRGGPVAGPAERR